MTASSDYEKSKYLNGMEAARRCLVQLREHFEAVTLNVSYTDNNGTDVALELEWGEDEDSDYDDDDDDDKPTKKKD